MRRYGRVKKVFLKKIKKSVCASALRATGATGDSRQPMECGHAGMRARGLGPRLFWLAGGRFGFPSTLRHVPSLCRHVRDPHSMGTADHACGPLGCSQSLVTPPWEEGAPGDPAK